MKTRFIASLAAWLMVFSACTSTETKNADTTGNPEPTAPANTAPVNTAPATVPAATETATQQATASSSGAAAVVYHYICPNKCAGGGSEGQGKCPVCNADLVHNDAYHNQQQQPKITTAPQNNAIQLNTANQTQPQQPPQPDPPQNAKGVWHYTCPKGCSGGAGQAIACTNCGTQLEHNAKYHE